MSDPIREIQTLADEAVRLTATTVHHPRATEIVDRLAGPLRVAIAGRVKAGKSTLLNALVGERLAATDAGECTKLVTVYRHAPGYEITATLHDGSLRVLTFRNDSDGLRIDLGGLSHDDVSVLTVGWPARVLRDVTLIDTPGLESLNTLNSRRTLDFLHHDSTDPSGADAVLYLMRHLHRSDADFLGSFMDRSVGGASPINAIAVLSRADEIGACRLDALESASRIASRYGSDANVRNLVSAVVPVAGLLAEAGTTLSEHEFTALRAVAASSDDEVRRAQLSADAFCDPALTTVTAEIRRSLLDRLGLFGVRFALAELKAERVSTSTDLAHILVERSGLGPLRDLIGGQFVPRGRVLKARTAMVALRALAADLAAENSEGADRLRHELDALDARITEFAELHVAHLVLSGTVDLGDSVRSEVEQRLVEDRNAPLDQQQILGGIERWRSRAGDAFGGTLELAVADTMVRHYESRYVP